MQIHIKEVRIFNNNGDLVGKMVPAMGRWLDVMDLEYPGDIQEMLHNVAQGYSSSSATIYGKEHSNMYVRLVF